MPTLSARLVVPALRRCLAVPDAPRELGVEVLRVNDLSTGAEIRLRGFEYSLARMLDGRRTAGEVVAAATQVGLPLSLEALDAFLTKLAARHLLAELPEAAGPSPAAPRECWTPTIRKLYRLALRKAREGHLDLAVEALDALLSEAPNTLDAHQLRHSLKAQLRSSESRLPFSAVFAQAERDWLREAAGGAPAPAPAPRPVRRAPRAWVGASAATLAAALLVFAGVVSSERVAATLVPGGSLRVFAPELGVTEELVELKAAEARLEELRRSVEAASPDGLPPEVREAYARAEAAVGWAKDDLERAP